MKYGTVFRARDDGVTVMVIGTLVRGLHVDEGGGRYAKPGEYVLITLDRGTFDPSFGGDYWNVGQTGWLHGEFTDQWEELETP